MVDRKKSPLKIKTTEAHMCTISERLEILSHVPFFQDLSPEELQWVNSLFIEKSYQVDEVVYLDGEPAQKLFVVANGRVKLLRHSLTGRDILIDLLTSGEYFGEISGKGDAFHTDTALAQFASCILVISRETFQQVIKRHPSVSEKVIEIISTRLQMANERVHQLSTLPVEGRIANTLLMLSKKFGEQGDMGLLLQVPLSREDLAGMTGTTTESASRVMSQFQKDGLIRAGRGWVALINREELEAIAGNELD